MYEIHVKVQPNETADPVSHPDSVSLCPTRQSTGRLGALAPVVPVATSPFHRQRIQSVQTILLLVLTWGLPGVAADLRCSSRRTHVDERWSIIRQSRRFGNEHYRRDGNQCGGERRADWVQFGDWRGGRSV
jgi:hypothetical protein